MKLQERLASVQEAYFTWAVGYWLCDIGLGYYLSNGTIVPVISDPALLISSIYVPIDTRREVASLTSTQDGSMYI